jgi:hypothetical protein
MFLLIVDFRYFVEGKSILKEKNPKNTFLVEVLLRGRSNRTIVRATKVTLR